MRFPDLQILSNVMKKTIFIFACMILGGCALVGCTGNGTAQSVEKDSLAVDSDSIVVVDSINADSICLE
jgi:hypothetical protein